jgi:hypothetical protein
MLIHHPSRLLAPVVLAVALAESASAATYVCTRTSENLLQQSSLVAGSCTPTGTYTGTPGDTVGSAATMAASAAVFCGSAQATLQAVVLGIGAADAGAAAVVYRFDLTNQKLQAYTAAGSPGVTVALAEGSSGLTLTNLAFSFIALCR